MKRLIGIAVIVCMVLSIFVGGCGLKNTVTTTSSNSDKQIVYPTLTIKTDVEYGITPGNFENAGIVCQKGDWLYYCTDVLYRVKTDGSGRQKICDDFARYINVVGEWIYYENWNDNQNIYRIKIDGSARQRLNDNSIGDGVYNLNAVYVVGDCIYFINDRLLQRMKTDGSEKQTLNEGAVVLDMNVVGEWIYYIDQYYHLYRVKTDGSRRESLNDADKIRSINVDNDWLYYVNLVSSGLYRIKIDGSGQQKLSDISVPSINVVGDWIYFDEDGLYRIKTDGSSKQKLNSAHIYNSLGGICVGGDWVYYKNFDDLKIHRCKTDGSGQELVH